MATLEMTNISIFKAPLSTVNFTIFKPFYFTITASAINLLLGFSANCLILWIGLKEMIQGRSSKIFILNEALVEVVFCFNIYFTINMYFFDCAWCKLPSTFLSLLLLVGRPLFLSFICLERYLAVLHPLIYLKLKPMKYRMAISAAGWIFIISFCVVSTRGIIRHYNFILPELLFFFLIKLYSCLMVLKALLRPGPGDNGKDTNQDKIKAFRVIVVVLVFTTITYGPIFVSLVLYYILDLETFLHCWVISLAFGLLLGFVYPFHYLKRLGKLPF